MNISIIMIRFVRRLGMPTMSQMGCIGGVYKFSDIRILDQTLVIIYDYFSKHNYTITVL